MSLSERISNWFNGVPEEYEEIVSTSEEPKPKENNGQVMSLVNSKSNNSIQKEQSIMVFKPSLYSDVKSIGKMLLEGKTVIVNFEKMDDSQSRRVIDFLAGSIFAIDGDMQKIGEKIFLCTPKNFKIEGNFPNLSKYM